MILMITYKSHPCHNGSAAQTIHNPLYHTLLLLLHSPIHSSSLYPLYYLYLYPLYYLPIYSYLLFSFPIYFSPSYLPLYLLFISPITTTTTTTPLSSILPLISSHSPPNKATHLSYLISPYHPIANFIPPSSWSFQKVCKITFLTPFHTPNSFRNRTN